HDDVLPLPGFELLLVGLLGAGDQHRVGAFGWCVHGTTSTRHVPTFRGQETAWPDNRLRAATIRVSTPVRSVGCRIGANRGELFDGMSCSNRPAAIALSTVSGSSPPTSQNTDGTPAARPNSLKSSLPVISGAGMVRSAPK